MSKMTVIQLLNKIANGEDLPEKIRYEEKIWKLNQFNRTYDNGECCFFEDYIDKNYVITDVLNDEVEIIEEDKKIEKIKDLNTDYYDKCKTYDCLQNEEIVLDILTLKHKINEIIDYLEESK